MPRLGGTSRPFSVSSLRVASGKHGNVGGDGNSDPALICRLLLGLLSRACCVDVATEGAGGIVEGNINGGHLDTFLLIFAFFLMMMMVFVRNFVCPFKEMMFIS
eukprot:gb/GECG01005524.1/.p1 GENE.gb/GECG01005524.1/~~gb/GECG01005524.1/.p1  ORF type:complete len:104 (+),score=8.91 gb/GECG01005524.1/:1-312(+)